MKGSQEENKTEQNPPILEGEKKINERINKMEEVIKRARKMEDLMDNQLLSLLPDVRLPLKFKILVLDKFDGTGCP